jgi:sulfur-oxidizing protein SoxY
MMKCEAKAMMISRRSALALGAGGVLLAVTGHMDRAYSATEEADAAIKAFAGDATISEGGINLSTPEIAENGNTVPIGVSIDSPMTEADHVQSIMILADGNPNPEVVRFNFTTASGVAEAKTRIRLAKTQNVIAVAKMSDGSVHMVKNQVKVTIGGCGG